MKKILILMFLFAMLVTSCKEVTEPMPQENYSLTGIWKLKYFVDIENNIKREPDVSKWFAHLDSLGRSTDSVKEMENRFTLYFYNFYGNPEYHCFIDDNNAYHMYGSSFSNSVLGRYSVDYNTNTLTTCTHSTLVLNSLVQDGHLYEKILAGLNQSLSFKLYANTLLLYYNDGKECLEFIKIGDLNE